MAMFLVVRLRSGPHWDASLPLEEQSDWPAHASFMDELVARGFVVLGGPLADERRVVLAVEAESEDVVRATLALDPWTDFASANGVRRALDDQARRTPGVTERAENQHGVPALRLGGAT